MNLLKTNKTFRGLFLSRIFNSFGSSLFSLAFLVYAASFKNATFYISLAAVISVVPNFLQAVTGYLADCTKNKRQALFLSSWAQTALFVLMAFLISQRSLGVFVICCLVDLVSNLLSSYKNGLEMPILQERVMPDEMQSAYGLFQGLGSVFQLIGQPLGVALLAIFHDSFMILAFINAASYFLSGFVLLESRKYLEISFKPSEKVFSFNLKEIWKNIQTVFSADSGGNNGNANTLIVAILLLNFIVNGVMSLIELTMKSHNPFGNNYGFAVMAFNVAFAVGLLLGSVFMQDFLKSATLKLSVLMTFCLIVVFALSLAELGFLALAIMFCMGYVFSKINPKFNGYVMEVIAPENLAKISGGISTLFASATSIGVIVFVALVNIIGLIPTLLCLAALAFLSLLYMLIFSRKNVKLDHKN